jgi:tetratricopeptide (TPR) repeat protein
MTTPPIQQESTDESEMPARRTRARIPWLGLAATIGILIALGWLLAPTLWWAYDVERAGQLMERGLAWPEPRRFDSLPQVRDDAALAGALAYLDDAIRRRPNHPHAYRLAGQIQTARGDWPRAAEALDRARERAPADPLLGWEASL